MPPRLWISLGALLAALGVAAGAMGAHALQDKLEPRQLASYETAVRYQLYHALALVVVGLFLQHHTSLLAQLSAWGFVLGIVLFSGGIYGWLATGSKPLVMIVPVGGTIWILSWLAWAVAAVVAKPGVAEVP